ncbi:MAG TPA: hypothetical protein VIU34_20110 [Steroidobacter sp.]
MADHAQKVIAVLDSIIGEDPLRQQRAVRAHSLKGQQCEQITRILLALQQQIFVGHRAFELDGTVFGLTFRRYDSAHQWNRSNRIEFVIGPFACGIQHGIRLISRAIDHAIGVGFHRGRLLRERLIGVQSLAVQVLVGFRPIRRSFAPISRHGPRYQMHSHLRVGHSLDVYAF